MEACGGIVCVGLLALAVIGFLQGIFSSTENQETPTSDWDEEFSVSYKIEDVADEDDTKPLPVMRLTGSGTITIPKANHRINWLVRITDITESSTEPYAIYCRMSELADHEGCFIIRQESRIPYVTTVFEELDLPPVPLFALMGPKKGWRKWQVHIAAVDFSSDDQAYTYSSVTIKHRQTEVGYLEYKEFAQRQEQNMAKLAIGMAAADGRISRSETSAIREFFSELFAQHESADDRKRLITETLQSTLEGLRQGGNSSKLIGAACQSFRNDDDTDATQQAYKLCVKVAAADGQFGTNEQKALRFIADRLGIPAGYVEEIHDREIRLHMKIDNQLGMPADLSTEDQKAWLTKEYRKWRTRTTHSKPDIASEATRRVIQITAALDKLNQRNEDDTWFDDIDD